ncbi:MAG: hypothetical protein ACE5MK_12455 [Acidobacteriota bacterium]
MGKKTSPSQARGTGTQLGYVLRNLEMDIQQGMGSRPRLVGHLCAPKRLTEKDEG